MQAFLRTSQQVRENDLPNPQSPSSLHPVSASQSGYYSVHRVDNSAHFYAHSISSSHPNSASSHFQSSPSSRNDLRGPQQTFSNQNPSSQPAYHSLQQQVHFSNQVSHGLHNGQFSYSSSQHNSQPSQGQLSGSQVHYRPSDSSTVHVQQMPAVPQSVPNANLNYYAQPSCTTFQDYKNAMQTMQQPAPQPQQTVTNGNQTVQIIDINQVQMTGASYDSTAQSPTVAQVLMGPLARPPPCTGSHVLISQGQLPYNVNPVQNSSVIQQQPSSNRPHNTHASQSHLNYTVPMVHNSPFTPQQVMQNLQKFVQSWSPEQNKNQSSSVSSTLRNPPPQSFNNVPQELQTRQATQHSNAVPFSDRHNKISLPSFPAHLYNNEPQGQQATRTMSVLTGNSQELMSCTSRSGEASHHTHSGHSGQNNGRVLMRDGSSVSTSINTQQRTTAGYPASVTEHTPTQAPPTARLHYGVPPNHQSEGEILNVGPSQTEGRGIAANASHPGHHSKAARFEGAEISRLQMSHDMERRGRQMSKKRRREVEHCTDPADCLEVVAALQKAARQVHRAIAVVPPISQQADSEKKDEAISPSEKNDSKQSETNAPSPPKEICSELIQTQNSINLANESSNCEAHLSANPTATGSQDVDCTQSESETKSKSQSPNMHQATTSSVDLSAKSPEEPNDQNIDSYSDDAMFDFSSVPVMNCTLEKLQQFIVWMSSLKTINVQKENELATDVIKCIVDLYWDGDINNMGKEVKLAQWSKTLKEMCAKEKETVVLQFVTPENLKRLACHYVMEHDTVLPARTFSSSWLNVDGNPADIDKILAEPISDYDFTWCKDASLSVPDGMPVVPVDSLVQVNAAEDLAVSTQNISEDSTVNPLLDVVQVGGNDVVQVVSPVENISAITSDGTAVSSPDRIVQVNAAEDLVVSTQNISEDSAVNPLLSVVQVGGNNVVQVVSPVENISAITSDGTAVSALDNCVVQNIFDYVASQVKFFRKELTENVLSDLFFSSQISVLKLDTNVVIEPQMNDFDPHVESGRNSYEKEDLSSADSTSDDLSLDIELLSTDDATAIFKEREEPPELCMEEAVFSISHLENLFGPTEFQSCKPPKFTCPHVTDTTCDGDRFCSKCLDETPLLDVDLDDSLLSPKEDGPNVRSGPLQTDSGNYSPFSSNEFDCLIEPISPHAIGGITPKYDSSEITIIGPPKPNNQKQSFSPMSVSQDRSTVAKVHKSLVQNQKAEKVKHPQTECVPLPQYKPFKTNKVSKTKRKLTQDVCFAPDMGIKKYCSPKNNIDVHSPVLASNGDNTNEERGEEKCTSIKTIIQTNKQSSRNEPDAYRMAEIVSAEMSNGIKAVWPKSPMIQKLEHPRSNSDVNKHQDNGCIKGTAQGLSLYGSCNRSSVFIHQCHRREKSFSTPVYIEIKKSPATPSANYATNDGKNYTDAPSAKQKIYKQWFSSLVQKQKTSTDKRKKQGKNELKHVILIQKNIMKERTMSKSDSEKSVKRDLKQKHQEPKT